MKRLLHGRPFLVAEYRTTIPFRPNGKADFDNIGI
jgi:hypothetical protein